MPLSGPQSNNVNVFTSGSLSDPIQVTSSQTSPVWVSGSVAVGGISIPPITTAEMSVGVTGSPPPQSATFIAGYDSGSDIIRGVHVDSSGNLYITGSITSVVGGTQQVTGTVAISNTSGPFGVTGTTHLDNQGFGVIGDLSSDRTNSGYITGTGNVAISAQGGGSCRFVVSGSWSGSLYFEQTENDTDWTGLTAVPIPFVSPGRSAAIVSQITSNGTFESKVAGCSQVRVRGVVTSGSAGVRMNVGQHVGLMLANVISDGVVDVNNATTATLGANASFTGTATDMMPYTMLTLHVSASHNSAVAGLKVQWSDDLTTWDTDYTYQYVTTDACPFPTFTRRARYYRLVYTNGSTPQTYFHLSSILQRGVAFNTMVGLGESLNDGNTGNLTRTVIVGKTQQGDYINVRVNSAGNLNMINEGVLMTGTTFNGYVQMLGGTTSGSTEVEQVHISSGSLNVALHDQNGPLTTTLWNGLRTLNVDIIQNVITSPGNSSTANLAAGAAFTGTTQNTLGINGIQPNIFTDQPVEVHVQQSIDGVNWDIDDVYTLPASTGDGRTFQATGAYLRVIVKNTGASPTTVFRLMTVIAPIVETLPRTLTNSGSFRVGIQESIPLTASIANLPTGFNSNITASITLPVTMSTSQVTAIWVTGSTGGSANVNITGSIPLSVTATSANPVQVTGVVGLSVGTLPVSFTSQSVTGTVSIGNTPSVSFVSQSITGTVSIGSIPAHGVTFVSQSVTGTVHVDNTSFGVTFTSQSVTGAVSVGNVVSITASAANPVRVTGVVEATLADPAEAPIGGAAPGSGMQVGLAAAGGFFRAWAGDNSGNAFVTGAVSVPNLVSVSQSTSPTTAIWVTGSLSSVSVEGSVFQTASAAGASATLIAGVENGGTSVRAIRVATAGDQFITNTSTTPIYVTSTAANPVQVTGTVGLGAGTVVVSQSTTQASAIWVTGNFATSTPATQSVVANITQSIPLTVAFTSQSITGTVSIGSIPSHAVTFVSQSVTGALSVLNVVSVSQSTTQASAIWVTGNFATSTPATQSVVANITQSIPLFVTATAANPVFITGSISANSVNPAVGGTGSAAPASATLLAGISGTGNLLTPVTIAAGGALLVTGSFTANSVNPAVAGTGSASPFSASLMAGNNAGTLIPLSASTAGALYVTSTVANPQQVTGTVHFDNTSIATTFVSQSVTGTVSIGNTPTVTFVSQSVTGTVHIDNTSFAVTASAANPVQVTGVVGLSVGNLGVTFVSQSVTGTVSVGNTVAVTSTSAAPVWTTGTVSIGNSPTVSFVSQSVTGTVHFDNISIGVTFVSQSVTGTVSVANVVSVSQSTAAASALWITGTVAANITASLGGGTQYGTGTVTNGQTGTLMLGNNAGTLTAFSATSLGAHYVTATVASPVQITGVVGLSPSTIPVTFVSQSVTGTVTIGAIPTHGVTFTSQSVTGTVSIGNIVTVTQSTAAASAMWITGTIHYDNPASGGGVQYGTGSTALYTGTVAFYVQESDGTAVIAKADTNHILMVNMVSGTVPAASVNYAAATGAATPLSGILLAGNNAGAFVPVSATLSGALIVSITGTMDAVFSGTQNVTSTLTSPVYVVSYDPPAGTAALTSTNVTNAGQTILTATSGRLGSTIYNNGPNAVYVLLGSGATFQAFTIAIASGAYYETPFRYVGIITAATSGVQTSTVRVTELTA